MMAILYAVTVLFAAVIFTNIIFDANSAEERRWERVGYGLTLGYFIIFAGGVLFSVLGAWSWTFRKRYRKPCPA